MPRKKFSLVFIAFFLLLYAILTGHLAPVSGQTTNLYSLFFPLVFNPPEPPVWIGPNGGYIIAVAVAPSQPEVIYAGTWGSGIYKSTNGGVTWVWKSQGLAHPYINSMAVDPHNAQIVYAGTYTGKIYKTLDGGETWFQSSTGIQDQAIVYSIAVDPLDSENIFIGTRGESNNGGPPWNGVLYRSADAGESWEPKLTNVGGSSQEDWVYSVTLHPRFPYLVYAATHEHGVYRSLDYGKHWEAVNDGITSMSTRGIVVNPNSGEVKPVLYTGVWKREGVFRSNNGGDDWFQVDDSSKDTRIYSLSINPKESFYVYASTFSGGVLKTSDGGISWAIVGLKDYEIPITAIDPLTPQILYAGTNGNGLFKSVDAGINWQPSQQGLHATKVSALQATPGNSLQLFAGLAGDGVKKSADGGQNWDILGTNLGDLNVLGLVMVPNNSQILFALTETDGLHRCDIGGTCWQKINIDFPLTIQTALDPKHPLATPPLVDDELATSNAIMATPALLTMKFAPSFPQIAYLGTSGAGVYKSVNSGNIWNAAGLSGRKIVSLVVAADDFNQVFVASDTQVWSSDDGGINWTDTGLVGVNIYALTLDPSGNLLAGTSNGVYQRIQTGWMHLGLAGLPVTAVAAHPNKVGWLYAGSSDGLRTSRNAGQSWDAWPLELDGITVSAIDFDPVDPDWLFISTMTQGVLQMQDWQ